MSELHHCGRLLVEVAASVGGLTREETAAALGMTRDAVREVERAGLRKVRRLAAMGGAQ